MKTAIYNTKVENMDGFVELRLPNFEEKYEYLDSLEVEIVEDAKVTEDEIKKRGNKENLKMLRRMVALSLPHYVRVDIRNSETGIEFKSVDDLQYTAEGHGVLIEMATILLRGTMGNVKKPESNKQR